MVGTNPNRTHMFRRACKCQAKFKYVVCLQIITLPLLKKAHQNVKRKRAITESTIKLTVKVR